MSFIPGIKENDNYMSQALELAYAAAQQGEVPIGAVVTDGEGRIIGRGYNQVESSHSQTAHAEMLAIKEASVLRGDWRLEDCWLYVTLEPCTMCMGLIRLSRLAGVVYGAPSPLFGYRLDNNQPFAVYKDDSLHIVAGVKEDESRELLKQFFEKKRKKRE